MKNQYEREFEMMLAKTAPIFKCCYIKIPDMIPTKERLRAVNCPEHAKPFDGVLVTMSAVYCIECKIDNNKKTDNQHKMEKKINQYNQDAYYVVNKAKVNSKMLYRISKGCFIDFETELIEAFFRWFNGMRSDFRII